jgi:hypothetical protein
MMPAHPSTYLHHLAGSEAQQADSKNTSTHAQIPRHAPAFPVISRLTNPTRKLTLMLAYRCMYIPVCRALTTPVTASSTATS